MPVQLKARDIIPGWPRGRSTSRLCSNMSAIEYMNWPRKVPFDSRFAEDLVGELAEDRRKAEMMEVYYWLQRIAARGWLYPEPISDRMFAGYRALLGEYWNVIMGEVQP